MGLLSALGGALDLFTGGVPIFSSIGAGIEGESAQRATNEQQIQLAREQMAFQKEMSSTSYQRGVKDMEAAGLNPMLAYSQGGASTTSGTMPVLQNPNTAGMNSAAQASQITAALQQVMSSQAQTDLLTAQADKTRSETLARDLNTSAKQQEINLAGQRERESLATTQDIQHRHPGTAADSAAKEARVTAMSKDKGAGWTAEVTRLKEEARLKQLERAKEEIKKLPYDLAKDLIPHARSTAKQIYENTMGDDPWWDSTMAKRAREARARGQSGFGQ